MAVVEAVRADTRESRLQNIICLIILTALVALAYGLNAAIIEDIKGRYPESTLTPITGLFWSLMFSVAAAATLIVFTKVITMTRNVSWSSLIKCYLLSSGWHAIGGLYVVWLWQSGGWPEPGGSILINFNVFGLTGPVGNFLQFVAIDELLHLGTYALMVGSLAGWRKAWWLYPMILAPWLVYTWVVHSLRP